MRSGMGKMQWRVLLRWRTWMSAWYMRATSATTDVSTRQAPSGVSASLDTWCKRMVSLVRKVKLRPPIFFVTQCYSRHFQWCTGSRKATLCAFCALKYDLLAPFLSGRHHLLQFVNTFTVYYFPGPFDFLPVCKSWYCLIIVILIAQ